MKKQIITIILLLSLVAVSFCQDNYYANRNEVLYKEYNPMYGQIGRINKGEQVFIVECPVNPGDGVYRKEVQTEDGKIGWLALDAISVVDSEVLPDEITNNEWAHSYYLDVLNSGNRETLFAYEPFWRDNYYKYKDMDAMYPGDEKMWYESAEYPTAFDFKTIYNRVRDLSNKNFYVLINGKISESNGVFFCTIICTHKRVTFEETSLERHFPINEKGTMALRLDGDYLDVFINENKMFTLIKLNEDIRNQYRSLMRNNICDLTGIVLPRRADGSTGDFSPIDMTSYSAFRRTLEEIHPPLLDADNTAVGVSQTDELVPNNRDSQSLPLWALIAIIGGAVVVAGGVVLFIVKRRK
ncbi:MAG: hypothetical protein LBI28_07965 [Treponema sp.]|jgi:hypothetical protein|nr:hypothetical protein [Treponema sp.]